MPVAGDVSQPQLGMADDDFAALTAQVDVVINSAATVAFDAPLNEALLHNTRSTQHVAEFARACRSAVLVHISTAYVAGRQSGRIVEGPLPDVAPAEIAVLDDLTAAILEEGEQGNADARETRARLVDAGMTRARSLGWHDTYTYTKALGEMVLAANRGTCRRRSSRPTIIESSLRDPMAGWIKTSTSAIRDRQCGRGRLPDFRSAARRCSTSFPWIVAQRSMRCCLRPTCGRSATTVGTGAANPLTGAALRSRVRVFPPARCSIDKDGPFPCPIGRSRHRSAFARCSPTRPGAWPPGG